MIKFLESNITTIEFEVYDMHPSHNLGNRTCLPLKQLQEDIHSFITRDVETENILTQIMMMEQFSILEHVI